MWKWQVFTQQVTNIISSDQAIGIYSNEVKNRHIQFIHPNQVYFMASLLKMYGEIFKY